MHKFKYILLISLLMMPSYGLSKEKKNRNSIELLNTQKFNSKIRNSIGQEFVYIKSGSFIMGSPHSEVGRDYDEKQHKVILTKNFYMQTTEVTRRQWFALMKTKPWLKDRIKVKGWDYPVTYVSWFDAKRFIEKLNKKEETTKYRLPTEAEWEYACRAGTTTKYSFGNSDSRLGEYAWYNKNVYDLGKMHCQKVKLKKSNKWGLYDMHGNVSEMCEDRAYISSHYGLKMTEMHRNGVFDPVNKKGNSIVVKGGSWLTADVVCRSAEKTGALDNKGESIRGFRIIRLE